MRRFLLLFCAVLAIACAVTGSGISSGAIRIDFTHPLEAAKVISFEPAKYLDLTDHGLGWDGEAAGLRKGSFTTVAVPVGSSWRPATNLRLMVKVSPAPHSIKLANGQVSETMPGQVFVRYSPDKKHWSSWIPVRNLEFHLSPEARMVNYELDLSVPDRAMEQYSKLRAEYAKLDVPWKDDEEAAVKWILQRDPDFFAREQPFIGYIQLLYEGEFYGGQRVKSFDCDYFWSWNGLMSEPRDPSAGKNRDGPWRFDASGEAPQK